MKSVYSNEEVWGDLVHDHEACEALLMLNNNVASIGNLLNQVVVQNQQVIEQNTRIIELLEKNSNNQK